MVKTYEDAKDEERERGREEERDRFVGDEYDASSPVTFEGERIQKRYEDIKRVLIATPGELSGSRGPRGGFDETRQEIRDEVEVNIEDALGVNFSDVAATVKAVEDAIKEETERDLSGLSSRELQVRLVERVGLLLQDNIQRTKVSQVMAEGMLQNVSATVSILENVRPYTNITVSGKTEIESAGEAQAVIPEAENTEIPTRTLFIRADPDNNDKIYFGDDKVQPEEGYVLTPGEAINIDVDFRNDSLWCASDTKGEQLMLIGVV